MNPPCGQAWARELERRADRAQNAALAKKLVDDCLRDDGARVNRALSYSNNQLAEINAKLLHDYRRAAGFIGVAVWIAAVMTLAAACGWTLVWLR